MKTYSAGFIGGGRITRIFLHGFQDADQIFSSVSVFDTNQEILTDLKKQFSFIQLADQASQVFDQELIFVALHPPAIMDSLSRQQKFKTESILVSLAPKITIDKLQAAAGVSKVIRMIPNATSYIHEGYNPISFSSSFDPQEKEEFLALFSHLGKTFEARESSLEGYAMISAMLPTYFWFQWQHLEQLGLQMGFSAAESQETVKETLLSAWKLFYESGLKPEEVMDLIPVKPIGDHEETIRRAFDDKLLSLYQKIKP